MHSINNTLLFFQYLQLELHEVLVIHGHITCSLEKQANVNTLREHYCLRKVLSQFMILVSYETIPIVDTSFPQGHMNVMFDEKEYGRQFLWYFFYFKWWGRGSEITCSCYQMRYWHLNLSFQHPGYIDCINHLFHWNTFLISDCDNIRQTEISASLSTVFFIFSILLLEHIDAMHVF